MSFLGRLLHKDALHDLKEVVVNLEFLAEAEEQISEFYRLCAGSMPKEADFWTFLQSQELEHAENARKMIGRITKEPKLYKPGISFSTVTLRMFALEVQRLVDQINAGRLSQNDLLPIALEIESSVVEVNYGKIVKTEDGIFNMLARKNDSESEAHRSTISSRLNAALVQRDASC